MLRSFFALLTLSLACCATSLFAQAPPGPQLQTREAAVQQASASAASFDQVVDRAIEREHFFMAQMKQLHPLVETYIQNLKEDKDLGAAVPTSDVYFLGRLDMSEGTDDRAFTSPTAAGPCSASSAPASRSDPLPISGARPHHGGAVGNVQ